MKITPRKLNRSRISQLIKIPSLLHALLLTASIAFTAMTTTQATVVVTYDAQSTSTAQNPTAQGWTAVGNFTDYPDYPPSPGQETIGGTDYNYWDISNIAPAPSNYSAYYRATLVASNFSDPEGWTASIRARILQAETTLTSSIFEVRDGSRRWEVSFVNNSTSGTQINLRLASGTLLLSTFDIGADYFSLQMYYDPTEAQMSFYLNGTLLGSPVAASDAPANTSRIFQWGDADGSGRAVRTDSHWNFAQFETGYAVIPEPSSLVLLLAATLLFLRKRNPARA